MDYDRGDERERESQVESRRERKRKVENEIERVMEGHNGIQSAIVSAELPEAILAKTEFASPCAHPL